MKLQDYTDTELVAEIKVRIANNSIKIPALAELFIITWDTASKHPNLPQKIADELVKMGKLKKETK